MQYCEISSCDEQRLISQFVYMGRLCVYEIWKTGLNQSEQLYVS